MSGTSDQHSTSLIPHRRPPGRALWEFTWACDLRCAHCLVDGGPNEMDELSTTEALDLADQIADLGVRAVTLSGGEPLLLRPDDLEGLHAMLRVLVHDPVLPPIVLNSIGYLSEEEPLIRPSGRARPYPFWRGCQCGVTSLGIEPDGGIKGCANQVGDPFVVGSVRDEPLQRIWDDVDRWFWLHTTADELTGTCAGCALGQVCEAGCTALAHAASGSILDNPYCLRAVWRRTGGPRR